MFSKGGEKFGRSSVTIMKKVFVHGELHCP